MAFSDLFDFGTGEEPDLPDTEAAGGGEYDVADASGNTPAPSKAALAAKIVDVSKNLGISPEDLATAISYESEGTFSPSIMGGAGKNYMGLIQFGPEERKRYGASAEQSAVEQMDAVERYLRDRGVKPGMGMLDLYSTINAGSPGRYNASDANNGGAPGTVRDKVEKQMADHRAAAKALLAGANIAASEGTGLRLIETQPAANGRPPRVVMDTHGTAAPTEPVEEEVANAAPVAPPPITPPPVIDGVGAAKALQALLNTPVQEIKAEKDAPASVANPEQGLSGQLPQALPQLPDLSPVNNQGTPTDKGLLADATTPPPAPLESGFISKLIQTAKSAGSEVANQGAQLARGAIESAAQIANTPNAAGGLLTKAVASVVPAAQPVADYFSKNFEAARQLPQALIPVDEPKNLGQKLARFTGNAFIPEQFIPTAVGTGILAGADQLFPPAAAKPSVPRAVANKLLATPQNTPALFGPVAPPRTPTPVMNTAGGPLKMGGNEWGYLGYLGVMTVGAIFAPRVFQKMASTALPTLRDVPYAEPGTLAVSDRISYARTFDDQWAGLVRDLKRMGADPRVVKQVNDNFHIQTGSTADRMINSAVSNGKMQTPTFTFQSKVPLLDLVKVEDEHLINYLNARDTVRKILEIDNSKPIPATAAGKAKQAAAGPTTYNGMTAVDAQTIVNDYDRAMPDLKQKALAYSDIHNAANKFYTDGEYATKLKYNQGNGNRPQFQQRNVVNHPDTIPFLDAEGSTKVVTDPLPGAPPQVSSPLLALRRNMQDDMRFRMRNEATGLFVDNMNKLNPGFFVEVPKENWAKQSTAEKRNTVSVYRRGVEYRYTTDPFYADVLKLDPYFITGNLAMTMYSLKRTAEMTSTGLLQPMFAITSLIRNQQLSKEAVIAGRKSPNVLNTAAAIPQQMIPATAKMIANRLDGSTNGWLRTVLGNQVSDSLAATLARTYTNSYFGRMETAGTIRGSFTEQQAQINNKLKSATSQLVPGIAKDFIGGLHEISSALHNAPAYAYARKNLGATDLPALMKESRELTGDNTVGGRYINKEGQVIRFEKGERQIDQFMTSIVRMYGVGTEFGRVAIPWWNATTQGIKAVGDQYLKSPGTFVSRLWLYQMLPTGAIYLWNRGLGFDPNGQSYIDYHMNGRTEYDRQMNTYIALPNRPAEEGIKIPRVQEFSFANRLMEDALHHISYSQAFQNSEDFLRTALQFVGAKDPFPKNNGAPYFSDYSDFAANFKGSAQAVFDPSMPPVLSAFAAYTGHPMTGGVFGGDSFETKPDPYNSNKGMNENLEAVVRALGTGTADVFGSGYAAFHQTPEGYGEAIKNATKAASKKLVSKAPLVRDMFDLEPPATGNTRMTDILFKEEKVINQLSKYYRTNSPEMYGGLLSTKPISGSGEKVAEQLLGPMPSGQSAGIDQLPPTNPLYKQFMSQVYNTFQKDSDASGGIGMKSIWKRYGMAQAVIRSLRNVNDGNNARWIDGLRGPDKGQVEEELSNFGIPTDDIRAVRNFYTRRQQATVKQLVFTIRAVKDKMNQDPNMILANGGKPIEWEDFDPYKGATPVGVTPPLSDENLTAPWTDGLGTN